MKQGHLDEALLARILDAELTAMERTKWGAHLAQCERCQAELDQLQQDARRFSSVLTGIDVPVAPMRMPTRRRGPTWNQTRALMAAAATGVLLLISISPSRAWIVTSFHEAKEFFVGQSVAPVEEAEPGQASPVPNQARLSIPISGDVLTVQVETRQVEGTITFQVTDDARSVAEIVEGGAEELVVSDGLRIVNTSESTASYVITVSATASVVRLIIGSDAERRYEVTSARQTWVVGLGRP